MGLFRRKPAGPSEPPEPDGTLPLSVEQAALLRRLVRETFGGHGREVVVEADHARDDSGGQFGLWNLAVLCQDEPERAWRGLVERHVESLLSPESIDDLTDDELLASVYLRLHADDPIDLDHHQPVEQVATGLVTRLAIDLPTQVTSPSTTYWDGRGGMGYWVQVGRTNLRRVLDGPDLEREQLRHEDVSFGLLLGESFFTASLALVLPLVLERHDAGADTGDGVLVAVPNRHQLVWRGLDDATIIPTINAMIRFARSGFDEGAGPVSPHLYWVRAGVWQCLTRYDDEGTVSVDVTPELQEILERITR